MDALYDRGEALALSLARASEAAQRAELEPRLEAAQQLWRYYRFDQPRNLRAGAACRQCVDHVRRSCNYRQYTVTEERYALGLINPLLRRHPSGEPA